MQQAKTLIVFDKADGDRIRQSLLDYLREADAEWPVVAHGQTYPAADAALQRLYVTYQQVQQRNETQHKFLVVALNNLDKMSAERTERVTVARPTPARRGPYGSSTSSRAQRFWAAPSSSVANDPPFTSRWWRSWAYS
jgi:hypothetical protein